MNNAAEPTDSKGSMGSMSSMAFMASMASTQSAQSFGGSTGEGSTISANSERSPGDSGASANFANKKPKAKLRPKIQPRSSPDEKVSSFKPSKSSKLSKPIKSSKSSKLLKPLKASKPSISPLEDSDDSASSSSSCSSPSSSSSSSSSDEEDDLGFGDILLDVNRSPGAGGSGRTSLKGSLNGIRGIDGSVVKRSLTPLGNPWAIPDKTSAESAKSATAEQLATNGMGSENGQDKANAVSAVKADDSGQVGRVGDTPRIPGDDSASNRANETHELDHGEFQHRPERLEEQKHSQKYQQSEQSEQPSPNSMAPSKKEASASISTGKQNCIAQEFNEEELKIMEEDHSHIKSRCQFDGKTKSDNASSKVEAKNISQNQWDGKSKSDNVSSKVEALGDENYIHGAVLTDGESYDERKGSKDITREHRENPPTSLDMASSSISNVEHAAIATTARIALEPGEKHVDAPNNNANVASPTAVDAPSDQSDPYQPSDPSHPYEPVKPFEPFEPDNCHVSDASDASNGPNASNEPNTPTLPELTLLASSSSQSLGDPPISTISTISTQHSTLEVDPKSLSLGEEATQSTNTTNTTKSIETHEKVASQESKRGPTPTESSSITNGSKAAATNTPTSLASLASSNEHIFLPLDEEFTTFTTAKRQKTSCTDTLTTSATLATSTTLRSARSTRSTYSIQPKSNLTTLKTLASESSGSSSSNPLNPVAATMQNQLHQLHPRNEQNEQNERNEQHETNKQHPPNPPPSQTPMPKSSPWNDLPKRLLTVSIGVPTIIQLLKHPITSWLFFQGAHLICLAEYRGLAPAVALAGMSDISGTSGMSKSQGIRFDRISKWFFYVFASFSLLVTIVPTKYLALVFMSFGILLRMMVHLPQFQLVDPTTSEIHIGFDKDAHGDLPDLPNVPPRIQRDIPSLDELHAAPATPIVSYQNMDDVQRTPVGQHMKSPNTATMPSPFVAHAAIATSAASAAMAPTPTRIQAQKTIQFKNQSTIHQQYTQSILTLLQHYQFGILYLSLGFHFLLQIAIFRGGAIHIGYLLFVVWMSDTGALIFGRVYGKFKRSTTMTTTTTGKEEVSTRKTKKTRGVFLAVLKAISPGKTVPGLVGAVVTGPLCALVFPIVLSSSGTEEGWMDRTCVGESAAELNLLQESDLSAQPTTSESRYSMFVQFIRAQCFERSYNDDRSYNVDSIEIQQDWNCTSQNSTSNSSGFLMFELLYHTQHWAPSFIRPLFQLLQNPQHQELLFKIALGLLLSISGIIGDLAESSIKRHSSKKDSGGLLPGHGGILDRFDSLLVAGVVYFYLVLG